MGIIIIDENSVQIFFLESTSKQVSSKYVGKRKRARDDENDIASSAKLVCKIESIRTQPKAVYSDLVRLNVHKWKGNSFLYSN